MPGALFGAFCGFGPPKTPIFAWYFQLFRKPEFTSRKCMNFQGIFGPFWQKVQKSLILAMNLQGLSEAFSGSGKVDLVSCFF